MSENEEKDSTSESKSSIIFSPSEVGTISSNCGEKNVAFLFSIKACDPRIFINLTNRDSLVEFGVALFNMLRKAIPELWKPPASWITTPKSSETLSIEKVPLDGGKDEETKESVSLEEKMEESTNTLLNFSSPHSKFRKNDPAFGINPELAKLLHFGDESIRSDIFETASQSVVEDEESVASNDNLPMGSSMWIGAPDQRITQLLLQPSAWKTGQDIPKAVLIQSTPIYEENSISSDQNKTDDFIRGSHNVIGNEEKEENPGQSRESFDRNSLEGQLLSDNEGDSPLISFLPLITVQLFDTQLNFQDDATAGSLVLSVSLGRIEAFQTPTDQEVRLAIEQVQLHVAPSDIDLTAGPLWLRKGSHARSSRFDSFSDLFAMEAEDFIEQNESPVLGMSSRTANLLRPITEPFPARCIIRIHTTPNFHPIQPIHSMSAHNLISHQISIGLPLVRLSLNSLHTQILINVITNLLTVPISSLLGNRERAEELMHTENDTQDSMGSSRQKHSGLLSRQELLSQEWEKTKQVNWRVNRLQWEMKRMEDDPEVVDRIMLVLKDALAQQKLQQKHIENLLFQERKLRMVSTVPNFEIWYCLEYAELSLVLGEDPFLTVEVGTLLGSVIVFDDLSGQIAVELGKLRVHNKLPRSYYPELLFPFQDRQLREAPTKAKAPEIQINAELGSPVDGMTVVKHFEVNIVPLAVQLTSDMISTLGKFAEPLLGEKEDNGEAIKADFLQEKESKSFKIPNFVSSASDSLAATVNRITPNIRKKENKADESFEDHKYSSERYEGYNLPIEKLKIATQR